jgi:hypothetical protein
MTTPKPPTLFDALIPIAALVVMLALSVYLFGSDSSYGPNQIVLTLAAASLESAVVFCGRLPDLLGRRTGHR